MASSAIVSSFCSVSPSSTFKCYRNQTLTLPSNSQFLSPPSFLNLNHRSLLLPRFRLLNPAPWCAPVVFAAQFDIFKVIQTAWKVGKDGVEAGTNLVPDSVPRPIARISVTVVALAISLFLLKSFLSTAFFALATMGFVYFIFIALNKDKGPRSGGGADSSEDPIEEARRIMEKYK